MSDSIPPVTDADPGPTSVEDAVRFLTALFDLKDRIMLRPIEIWSDAEGKHSPVDYKETLYRHANPAILRVELKKLIEKSRQNRTNIFFGVCPRLGSNGQFDLAWQIRTARFLWVDIDHATVDEVRERIATAGLPPPSIIVNSGNGAHVYWLLEEPYRIDDVGDPSPIKWEKTPLAGGLIHWRKYVMLDDDKTYLDRKRSPVSLSAKAVHLQGVIAGISKRISGDNTQDLTRLLRIPGTLNRKDERNGKPPMPCTLVELDGTRRYPFSLFEPFKIACPEAEVEKRIAQVPLPQVRRVSPKTGDQFGKYVTACLAAAPGERSETDFALCCFAVRKGMDQEIVWSQVAEVGKFGERGRAYFDRTWDSAADEVRHELFEKVSKSSPATSSSHPNGDEPPNSPTADDGETRESSDDPFTEDFSAPGDSVKSSTRPTIRVDTSTTMVGTTMHKITDCLLAAGTCFSRSDQLVVVHGERIDPIFSSAELAGLLNEHTEFYFADDEGGEYRPLPQTYAGTWLNQRAENARLPVIRMFTRNPVFTADDRLVGSGYDPDSGIYYAGPPIEARSGTEYLDAVLKDFCFHKPGDRTNYLGMLITVVLMPRFIGSKPSLLLNGNQPLLGKSILAQLISILRDGRSAETASYNPNDEEFEKRLGAIVRNGATTIIIDNAKTNGRTKKIDSPCLERSITDPTLSFRLLGQSASIQAENSHIFCITANSAEVSPDLITRSVVVNLYYEGDPKYRQFTIADPETYVHTHRTEILGELLGMVERWKASDKPLAHVATRFNKRGWGNIIGGILEVNGEPDFLANAEEAAAALDDTQREFAELVALLVDHPRGTWTPGELSHYCASQGLLHEVLGQGTERSRATKFGTHSTRFVNARFKLLDGRVATFVRSSGRKGTEFRVRVVDEVPNLGVFAEPLPNLDYALGSAP